MAGPDPVDHSEEAGRGGTEEYRREEIEQTTRGRPAFAAQLARVEAEIRARGVLPRELERCVELALARRATHGPKPDVRELPSDFPQWPSMRDWPEHRQRNAGMHRNQAAAVPALRARGWSEAAIEVWLYPYRHDLRELYAGDTTGRLAWLEREWHPVGPAGIGGRDTPGHVAWPSYDALPPEAGVYRDPSDGHYYRNVRKPLGGADLPSGERVAVYELVPRPVALTLAEARDPSKRGRDYYHPADCPCGVFHATWIRDGHKAEREAIENVGPPAPSDEPPMRQLTVQEFIAEGGQWPPPRTIRDDYRDLCERREEVARELRLVEARPNLHELMGGSREYLESEARRLRGELAMLDRALASMEDHGDSVDSSGKSVREDGLSPGDAESTPRRPFVIRDLDPDTTRERLRFVLKLAEAGYSSAQISKQLSDAPAASTVRDWLREARSMRDRGELYLPVTAD